MPGRALVHPPALGQTSPPPPSISQIKQARRLSRADVSAVVLATNNRELDPVKVAVGYPLPGVARTPSLTCHHPAALPEPTEPAGQALAPVGPVVLSGYRWDMLAPGVTDLAPA